MHDTLGGEVVKSRAELQRQRDQLLGRQRPVAADQGREPRALEMLEHQMRARAVEDGVEAAHDHRMLRGARASAPRRRGPRGCAGRRPGAVAPASRRRPRAGARRRPGRPRSGGRRRAASARWRPGTISSPSASSQALCSARSRSGWSRSPVAPNAPGGAHARRRRSATASGWPVRVPVAVSLVPVLLAPVPCVVAVAVSPSPPPWPLWPLSSPVPVWPPVLVSLVAVLLGPVPRRVAGVRAGVGRHGRVA